MQVKKHCYIENNTIRNNHNICMWRSFTQFKCDILMEI